MTKDKLLELYQKFKDEKIPIQEVSKLRNCKDEEIEIVLNSKYPTIMTEMIINNEFNNLTKVEKQEIIKMFNNTKNEKIAQCIYYIVRSGTILSSGKTIELSKIISNSEEASVLHAKDAALSMSILVNKDGIEIIKEIAAAKTEEQANISKLIAQNIDALASGYVLEIIKISRTTNNLETLKAIHSISTNKNILRNEEIIKIIKLASKIKTDEIAKLITKIATNNILEKNNRSLYYITRMLLENNYEDILKIYNEAQELIVYIKNQEQKEKKDNQIFWNMYKQTPEEAINLLKQNVKDNEQINTHTKIKIK